MHRRYYRPKHVELIEVINKLSLLRLVGCLYYCICTRNEGVLAGTPLWRILFIWHWSFTSHLNFTSIYFSKRSSC